MNTRGLVRSFRSGKTWAWAVAFIALLLAIALPKAALAADDYEAASAEGLTTQAGGLTLSTNTLNFFMYPGYTQGQSVRAITVTNNTGATVNNIHFANFKGTKGTFADGSTDYAPYGVVDTESGAYFLTNNFFAQEDDGSIAWTDWAIENGYTSYTTLGAGQSRTYYLAIEVGGLWNWSTLVNGTDLTDTVDLVSSAGTNTLTLRTRVYEPAAGVVKVDIGTKPEAIWPNVTPASSVTLSSLAAGSNATTATIVGFQNTSTAVDAVSGAVPEIVLYSAGIENDTAGAFELGYYRGSQGSPLGSRDLNTSIGPDMSATFAVSANATYLPAGTYTANLCFTFAPGTATFNSGVKVQPTETDGVAKASIPISVTVTGSNPNLRPAPKNMTATGYNKMVVVKWDAVPASSEGYDGYVVWRTGGGVDDVAEFVYGTETQYVDHDVENGKTYTYYVGCANGGTIDQDWQCPKAGPAKATPSADAPMKLDQPYIVINLDSKLSAVAPMWYLQDFNDDGAGIVDHFNVYLNKKLVTTVKQSDVQKGRNGYCWTCDVPVKVPYQQYYVNVAAVAVDGTEGIWSDTAYGEASSATPLIDSAALMWDYEAKTITASARVWLDDDLTYTLRIVRDGTQVGTAEAGNEFVDHDVQARRTYTYTFTAVSSTGEESEPYTATIYADPNDYSNGVSDEIPVTVTAPTIDDPTAVGISVETKPDSTYVVERNDDPIITVEGTGETVEIVDHPGTGVHQYQVKQNAPSGTTIATSPKRVVEVVVDAKTGETVVVKGGDGGNGGQGGDGATIVFTDVPEASEGGWFHDSVYYVAAKGLMGGYTDSSGKPKGLFGPYDTMQRAQLAVVLWRYATGHDSTYDPQADKRRAPLTDIEDGKYYTEAANWAYENGIITGVADKWFDPYGNVTMEQFVTIMARYFDPGSDKTHSTDSLARFPDGKDVPAWADNAMAWCVDHGLVKGYDDPGGPFLRPGENMQRGRAATLFARCYADGLMY